MPKKNESINFDELTHFEALIYAIMKNHEIKSIKSTINEVNF